MINTENISEIDVQPFDLSSKEKRFLAVFNNKHFEISSSVAELIDILKQSDSLEEIASILTVRQNKIFTQEDVCFLIDKCIVPIIKNDNPTKKKTFIYERDIIPSEKISIVSEKLKKLFFPPIVVIFLICIVILEVLFFVSTDFDYQTLGHIGLFEITGILLFYIFSSLFHELGHASACKYFKSIHGNIGFGLYLNFPVFYTDVSGIWKLSRKQRLIINMAGVYFQMIYLCPFIIFSFIFPDNIIIRHFVLIVNLNLLFTLNPFFKFDGYWMMSDLLGVPNLRKRGMEYLAFIYKKIRKFPIQQKPFLLTMKTKGKRIMIIYSMIVNIFMGIYFCYFLPRFIYSFFSTFPLEFSILIKNIAIGVFPPFQTIYALFSQLIFFLFSIYLLYVIISPFVKNTILNVHTKQSKINPI
ncbi:MAG: hypothetical protein LBE13_08695 [Bacteroidales bacterium]|jgi:putative peptide zinc metalloprotease protein|nr:hypothetical protein [Bacteroidales bacterium]